MRTVVVRDERHFDFFFYLKIICVYLKIIIFMKTLLQQLAEKNNFQKYIEYMSKNKK